MYASLMLAPSVIRATDRQFLTLCVGSSVYSNIPWGRQHFSKPEGTT